MVSGAGRKDLWIRRFHPPGSGALRLVCLPHAGGSASYYFPLLQMLAGKIEVLSVQYPGRQDRRRERRIESIPELADGIFEALSAWTDVPFAFFGHSMGAILGFEVARRFQESGQTGPLWLFASGRRAPSLERDNENVHLGDDADIVAELRRSGATDQRLLDDPEIRETILPVVRSDYRAIETYSCTPGARLECPITAMVGDSDPKTTIDEASAWRGHSAAKFELRIFPGGHFYLDGCRSDVADTISRLPIGLAVATSDEGSAP